MSGSSSDQGGKRPSVTCFLPGDQDHETGRLRRRHPFLGTAWALAAGERGVAARCSVPTMGDAETRVLVQLHHGEPAGRTLAEIVVDTGDSRQAHAVGSRPIAAADWQHELVGIPAGAAAASIEVHGTGAAVRCGVISAARGGRRPFYGIAHMCNSPRLVERALAEGANAIECDVRVEGSGSQMRFHAFHGFRLPYGTRGLVRTPLPEFVSGLERAGEALALVVFDCKPIAPGKNPDYRAYGTGLAALLLGRLDPRRCLISVHSEAMTPVFEGVSAAGFGAGFDVNMIDNVAADERDDDLWIDRAERAGVTMLGLGTDCFVPWDLLRSWIGPVASAVNGRDSNGRVRKTYYWTLASAPAMRKMLDLQVDGLLVNDPRRLAALLDSEPYRSIYRLATASDSQFAVHGRTPPE